MNYPLSELIDRYSILLLKCERLPKDQSTLDELQRFKNAITQFYDGIYDGMNDDWVNGTITQSKDVNGKIWELESDIRKGKEGELGLEEVGRRALAIRDLNKQRIAIKNEVAEKMGEHKEIKGDHASE